MVFTVTVKLIYIYIYIERSRLSDGMGMVLNATFNNISIISWRSVLLLEETWVPRENHRPVTSHWLTLSHNVILSTPRLSEIQIHNVSGDCIGSCKSNYHKITTITAPWFANSAKWWTFNSSTEKQDCVAQTTFIFKSQLNLKCTLFLCTFQVILSVY